jgi:predicted Rossmann fold flavoprotein
LNYTFQAQINWLNIQNEDAARELLVTHRQKHPEQQIGNSNPAALSSRLWLFLVEKAEIKSDTRWSDVQGKPMNKLLNILTNDSYSAKGKTTFKEEFVTCGGVSLDSINLQTMESSKCQGIYFAGEVLDIDGVTGGFNFQAAWTTGFIAGCACAASLSE